MKAIALVSGGLDSILAAVVVKQQGIEVVPLYFEIPFCHHPKPSPRQFDIAKLCLSALGTGLKRIDISTEFLSLLRGPEHGFGTHINPCIDCKIMMLTKAASLMVGWGTSFVVTGEVLGQRPMSQNKQALALIEKESGLEGLLLRPLCALLLPQTLVQKQGWIKEEGLLAFSGRSRKSQMELAHSFGITEYNQPAGGCLLTDPGFSRRLKELIDHDELDLRNVGLLKFGRHFRILPKTKLIVGRNEEENIELESACQSGDHFFMPSGQLAGPSALGRGIFDDQAIKISCAIIGRYCDLNGAGSAQIDYRKIGDDGGLTLQSAPMQISSASALMI